MAKIYVTASVGTNTGRTSGDIRMGRIKALIPTRGKEFTEAELADSASFKTALQAALNLDRESAFKCFIIDGIREANDNTGDPQEASMGDGYTEIINEALPKYTLRNTKGVAEQQAIVAFNGWKDPVFILDDKNVLWYRDNGLGGAKGFSSGSFYANPPRPGNTGAINANDLRFAFGDVDEFKSGVGALKLDFTTSDLTNIVDVTIKEVADVAAMVATVGVFNKFAGTSLYSAYKAGLSQKEAWEFVNVADGTVADASAVAAADATPDKNGGYGAFQVTKAAGAGTFLLRLKTPAQLLALATPVKGIESVACKITFA